MVLVATLMANFVMIDVLTHYKAILEKPWLHKMIGISSTFHKVFNYPT